MKHTPEPWQFEEWNAGINNAPGFGLIAEHGPLSVTVHTRCPKGDGFGSLDCTELAKANAERIVNCINACAGIPDPAAAIPAAVQALEQCLPDWWALEGDSTSALSDGAVCCELSYGDVRAIAAALKLLKP